jgi:hypothetical protein
MGVGAFAGLAQQRSPQGAEPGQAGLEPWRVHPARVHGVAGHAGGSEAGGPGVGHDHLGTLGPGVGDDAVVAVWFHFQAVEVELLGVHTPRADNDDVARGPPEAGGEHRRQQVWAQDLGGDIGRFELDPTWWGIRALAACGLASGLRCPPAWAMEHKPASVPLLGDRLERVN